MNFQESELIPLRSEDFSPPISKRPKRADALANRCLILETAQQLFAEHGIANVKMVTIAETAGIGQGTLYRAFANKGELCLALMDADLRTFQAETLQTFRAATNQFWLNPLEMFLNRLIHFLDCHSTLMCEVQGYEIFGDEINHTGLHSWFHKTIHLLLSKAQANGELRVDAEIAYVTDVILAALHPHLFTHQRQVLGFTLEKISQELRQLILNGIKAEA